MQSQIENSLYSKNLGIACWVTRSDTDIALESSKFDQMTIFFNAFLLLVLAVVGQVAWTAFWASFLPFYVAFSLAMLVTLIVFMINQAFAASDWELAGVLRTESLSKGYWGKVLVRVLGTLPLAAATAFGATFWMFSDSIENHLQNKRVNQNTKIEKLYDEKKIEISERLITPITKEIETLKENRKQWQNHYESSLKKRDEARVREAEARVEAGRQNDGGFGYVPGQGPKWKEAKRQEREAKRAFDDATERMNKSEQQLGIISQKIVELTQKLEYKNTVYQREEKRLDSEKVNDPRWISERDGPLMRFIALNEIKKDPAIGAAATQFYWLIAGVLLMLELSFLFIKIACSPASVYTVRLITRAKTEASALAAEYVDSVEERVRQSRPRTKLRVVGKAEE